MNITGKTKLLGIFGDPVEHTLSPAMQNAALRSIGMDAVYLPFHVKAKELKDAVEAVRSLGLLGVNVTIPHKEAVMKYLDGIDEHAKEAGAVNTIVNRGGKLIGYNTDGPGYVKSLKTETGFAPRGKNILIIGAGGAARGILNALLKEKPGRVFIANRTVSRATRLAKDFKGRTGTIISPLGLDGAGAILAGADLLVNTTAMGMRDKGSLGLPLKDLNKKAVVSDIVYRPLQTGLLKEAKRRGLKTHGGLGMLVHQGALGFTLWIGKRAPIEAMRKAALKELAR